MKTLVLLQMVILPMLGLSQVANSIDLINHPYHKGSPLEKHTVKLSVKVRVLGYGGADSYLEIKGTESKLNIQNVDSVYFQMRMDKRLISSLSLYKSEVTRNSRRVKYYQQRTFSGAEIGGDKISINVENVADELFRITPSNNIEPGEYMLVIQGMTGGMGEAFPFSVGVVSKEPGEKAKKKKGYDDVYGR